MTTDLNSRLAQHATGRGARLLEVITAAGIGFTLARTWPGTRSLERQLENRQNSPRLCPTAGRPAPPRAARLTGGPGDQRPAAGERPTR